MSPPNNSSDSSYNGPSLNDEVSFLSGVDENGNNVSTNYWSWNLNSNPPTYNNTVHTEKWGPVTDTSNSYYQTYSAESGTPGGTVSYYFNPSSNWSAAEKETFSSTLDLWSSVANINFVESSTDPTSGLTITRSHDGQSLGGMTQYNPEYTSTTPAVGNPYAWDAYTASITIDTSVPGWNDLSNFGGTYGGSGVQTALHEEGHVLGLGHAGPYSDTAGGAYSVPSDAQYSAYDSRQWSIMSYIDPSNQTVQYASDTAATGITGTTNWQGENATTPMPVDILAAQRLYGVATNSPLTSGGQVFGFNSNISGDINKFYNFKVNTKPVVTIWDAGSNNTLDLSGFSSGSHVNLNPGTFSSADGMTNNIGIAFNTSVNTAIGGPGNDTFVLNGGSDTINGGGGSNTAVFSGKFSSYAVTVGANNITLTSGGVTDTLQNVQTLQFADQTISADALPCFVQGTLIRTPRGDVAVERLAVGDLVLTASGNARPVRWLGHTHRHCLPNDDAPASQNCPVRVAAHAFGPNLPEQDLYLSPGHAVAVSVVTPIFIPVGKLVNGATIAWAPREDVTYWHVELDSHDILISNGLPSESYLDVGNRDGLVACGGAVDLARDAADLSQYAHPFLDHGPVVDAIRLQLVRRAEDLGWRRSNDTDLHLTIDGQRLDAVMDGDLALFVFPATTTRATLHSRTFRPCDRGENGDARRLGLNVQDITISDGLRHHEALSLDHPVLASGFHQGEAQNGCTWRWTHGQMPLTSDLWQGCRSHVILRLRHMPTEFWYWQAPVQTAEYETSNVTPLRLRA